MTRMIKTSEFEAKCLAIIDEVERTGDPVVRARTEISESVEPWNVLQCFGSKRSPPEHLIPDGPESPRTASRSRSWCRIGPQKERARHLEGPVFVTGDIISPIDVEWNALK